MKKVTPRTPQMSKANEGIGKIFNSNMFSTMKGNLLYIDKGKCYFEIIENPNYLKYNDSAGQIEYLPESMVVCMESEN